MRTTVRLLPALLLLATAPAHAGGRDQALATLERAIKAHGGADRLARARLATRSDEGTLPQAGRAVPFTSEVTRSLPDKVRLAMVLEGRFRLLTVINGDKGWQQAGGVTRELPGERVQELAEEAYVWWLATLVPLARDPFSLESLPDARVDGKPAAVVRVSAKGHPDARLFFDRRSGLLVKIERRATEAGVPVDKEYRFAGFKDFDGTTLPTKETMSLNGKKWTDTTIASWKFLREADKDAFGKP